MYDLTLPGQYFTGPYNDLDKQVKYDPKTGQILKIYQQPTGKTDAISMQHDVDYAVCKDDSKDKHRADKKKRLMPLLQSLGMRDNGAIGLLEMLLILKES